ncbi:MAG: hydrogenase maturation peptidase HycI [Candidatus Bathyarchaeia archaeon]|nr:hydrogenase maturation peptidase HycI [Candidatus Bathyarchaeota archaeon]
MDENLEKELKSWISGFKKIVILGIGNPIRRDDYIGVAVAKLLKEKNLPNVLILECETVPESFTNVIKDVKPTHVLMIDAANLNATPGFAKIIDINEIEYFSFSTHDLPLSLLAKFIAYETNAKIALLGIQPKSLDFGEGLTSELVKASEEIAKTIEKVLIQVNL